MKTKFSFFIFVAIVLFSSKIYSQLNFDNILFTFNQNENFLIDNYKLYTEKGIFEIEDEPFKENFWNYFLRYKGKIIGYYKFNDVNDYDAITCTLYEVDAKISREIGISEVVVLDNIKRVEFESFILESLNSGLNDFLNSPEILNNKGYFLYQYKYYDAALLYFNKVIEKFPNRVVAFLNRADCQWELKEKEKAKRDYKKYVQLMKEQNKDLTRIPKYVYERMKE